MFADIEPVDVDLTLKSVFKDMDWMHKSGIGGIFTAVGVVALLFHFACVPIAFATWALIVGYTLRVMRVKDADQKAKLPEWNDWGDLFLSGITWIAVQSLLWILMVLVCVTALIFCTASATTAGPDWQTLAWSICATVLPALTCVNLAYVATYVMVNFAVEENSRAGVAYLKVMKRIARHPAHYFAGFLLAVALQWAAVILPIVTVIGVVVIPSSYFIGQLLSAVILARFWAADPDSST